MLTYIKAEPKVLAPLDVEYVISRPWVQELLLFIQQQDEAPILRTIKAAFSNWDTHYLSEIMDLLIQEGYVERKNRRYYYAVPMITEMDIQALSSKVEPLFSKWQSLLENSMAQWKEQVGEKYFPLLITKVLHQLEEDLLCLRPKLVDIQAESLIEKKVMVNQASLPKAQFIGISPLLQNSLHFHDYLLQANRGTVNVNPTFEALYQEVGDVNGDYLMDQCLRKIKRANRRQELNETDFNLFNETLVQLSYFQQDGSYYKLRVPVWRCEAEKMNALLDMVTSSSEYQSIVDALNQLVDSTPIAMLPYWLLSSKTFEQYELTPSWIYVEG